MTDNIYKIPQAKPYVGGLKGRFIPPGKPTTEKVRFGEGEKAKYKSTFDVQANSHLGLMTTA